LKENLLAFGFFAFFSAIYFWGVIMGHSTVLGHPDNSWSFFAWYQLLGRSIRSGLIPLWDPNVFCGTPFAGQLITGVFYPPNLLLAFIFADQNGISEIWITYLIIVHSTAAAFFTFKLSRYLRCDLLSSMVSGVSFSFLGFVAYRIPDQLQIYFGCVWLPLTFLYFKKSVDSRKIQYVVLSAFSLSLSLLAGHVMPTYCSLLVLVAYGIIHISRNRDTPAMLAMVKRFIVLAALVIGLSSIQILLAVDYSVQSYRWVGEDNPIPALSPVPYEVAAYRYYLPLGALIDFVNPRYVPVADAGNPYFGVVPLSLTLLSIAGDRKKSAKWAVIGILSLLVSMGHQTPLFWLVYTLVPFASLMREPVRYVYIFHFATAITTALGGRLISARLHFGRALLIVLLMATCADTLIVRDSLGVTLPVSVPSYVPSRVYRKNPIINTLEREYPYYRVINLQNALPPNVGDVYRIATTGGYSAGMLKRYFDFLSIHWDLDSPIYDLLGAKYVVSWRRIDIGLKMVQSHEELYLYQRKRAVPKIWAPTRVIFVSDDDYALELLRAIVHPEGIWPDSIPPKPSDPVSTVVVTMEGAHIPQSFKQHCQLEFSIIEYSVQGYTISVRTSNNCFAVASEIWSPGWRLYMNGTEKPIAKAYSLLNGIWLEKGECVVQFVYRPDVTIPGSMLSILSLSIALVWFSLTSLERTKATLSGLLGGMTRIGRWADDSSFIKTVSLGNSNSRASGVNTLASIHDQICED